MMLPSGYPEKWYTLGIQAAASLLTHVSWTYSDTTIFKIHMSSNYSCGVQGQMNTSKCIREMNSDLSRNR